MPIMLLVSLALIIAAPPCSAQTAADFSGTWCTQADTSDCLRIQTTGPDAVSASFLAGGRQYAEGTGFARDGKLTLSFRRTDRSDIGFASIILRDLRTADGRTFNSDGSQRWKGVYMKR